MDGLTKFQEKEIIKICNSLKTEIEKELSEIEVNDEKMQSISDDIYYYFDKIFDIF